MPKIIYYLFCVYTFLHVSKHCGLVLFVLGEFLWVTIAYMNINVMKALCMKEEHNQSNNITFVGNTQVSARKEETAYAWLMLF